MIYLLEEQEQSMINYFPFKTGISTTPSAINTIEGRQNLDHKTMYINLGAYVQFCEETKTRSTAGR